MSIGKHSLVTCPITVLTLMHAIIIEIKNRTCAYLSYASTGASHRSASSTVQAFRFA